MDRDSWTPRPMHYQGVDCCIANSWLSGFLEHEEAAKGTINDRIQVAHFAEMPGRLEFWNHHKNVLTRVDVDISIYIYIHMI